MGSDRVNGWFRTPAFRAAVDAVKRSPFQDWQLLEHEVVALLADVRNRRRRVWSIGAPTDAVAVAAAVSKAGRRDTGPGTTVFASGEETWENVRFTTAELRGLSVGDRELLFRRRDARWIPTPEISASIRLGRPGRRVDLITVNPPDAGSNESAFAPVVERLNPGGRLFVSTAVETPPGTTAEGAGGRLFRKLGEHDDTVDDADDDPTATLAARQTTDDLVAQYRGLATALARRFAHRGQTLDELEGVARLALVRASRRYDGERGAPFGPYAATCIVGELKRHFRDHGWSIRVPRSVQELCLATKRTREDLGHQLGRAPTVLEVAEQLGVSEESLLEAMDATNAYRAESLDALAAGHDDRPPQFGAEDADLDLVVDRERLRQAMPTLSATEQIVVRGQFFEERTQTDLARELGVSQMQVSRILARALGTLRA